MPRRRHHHTSNLPATSAPIHIRYLPRTLPRTRASAHEAIEYYRYLLLLLSIHITVCCYHYLLLSPPLTNRAHARMLSCTRVLTLARMRAGAGIPGGAAGALHVVVVAVTV